ncbi:MAG: iron complex outerrane recepter protein [Verrucomicrobiales bacterium]|nr:iron complex outerrane recepter protein [Verrucomicrobiales bacterium]
MTLSDRKNSEHRRWLVALMAAATPGMAFAQAPEQLEEISMEEVVVTSSPLGRTLFQQAQAVSILEGAELRQALQPSLGDTLAKLPGVNSTGFAPGAGRPVIRGLGEDRIRVLNNGVNVLDVSNVSPDHAVTVDPLVIEKVEVVRGPAGLLYGPNGVGGVVNVLDGRIPLKEFQAGANGWPVSGKLDSRYGSGSDLWSGGGSLETGKGPVAVHIDAFDRKAGDLKIPGAARSARLRASQPLEPGEKEVTGRLPNSFTESRGGSAGASYFWDGGFFGGSWSTLESRYGTVAEPDVTIGLEQEAWSGRGAFYEPFAGIAEISYRLGFTEYEHTEFEGAEAGTLFKIEGHEGRVEMRQEKVGALEGTFGVQWNRTDFSALGEEAFLPRLGADGNAVFVFEELTLGDFRWQAGMRYDRTEVASQKTEGFGEGWSRDFDALSGSAGVVWDLPGDWSAAVNAAYTQRAPTYVELLADGPHLATAAYERGDRDLKLERSLGVDVSLRKTAGAVTGSVSGFYNRFSDYIGAFPEGGTDGDLEATDGLPLYQYSAVGANFMGGEAEVTFHLWNPAESGAEETEKNGRGEKPERRLDLEWKADYVYTTIRGEGDGLPRIPPFRTSAALVLGVDRFTGRIEGQYSAAQRRTADFEEPTDSFFLLNAGLSWQVLRGPVEVEIFVRGTNLLNEEARLHTSFLKEIAPMEGRAVMVGMSAAF